MGKDRAAKVSPEAKVVSVTILQDAARKVRAHIRSDRHFIR